MVRGEGGLFGWFFSSEQPAGDFVVAGLGAFDDVFGEGGAWGALVPLSLGREGVEVFAEVLLVEGGLFAAGFPMGGVPVA